MISNVSKVFSSDKSKENIYNSTSSHKISKVNIEQHHMRIVEIIKLAAKEVDTTHFITFSSRNKIKEDRRAYKAKLPKSHKNILLDSSNYPVMRALMILLHYLMRKAWIYYIYNYTYSMQIF